MKNNLGIYLKAQKKYYYLEVGDNYISNHLDRIKKALIQRELLKTKAGPNTTDSAFEVMTYQEASDKDLEIVPIFLSNNVRRIYEESSKKTSKLF